MTIRFNKSQGTSGALAQYFKAPDHADLTYPNADWCVGLVVVFDGLLDGNATTGLQYLVSTGGYQAAGSFQITFYGSGTTTPGIGYMLNTGGTPQRLTSMPFPTAGEAYQIVIGRVGDDMVLRACPVLGTAPVDGSAVYTNTYTNVVSIELNGPQGLHLGVRGDATPATGRLADQSMGRFFRYDGQLTDLEVARLAYGEEITDLGYTPVWYSRMNDNLDFDNTGSTSATVVFAKNGSPANGTDPGFGYSAPVAPVFLTAPAIVGTPQDGISSSYTSGTYSGTAASSTQQWYIDAVAIPGATAPTYMTSGDVGGTLTIEQTLTNDAGSDSEVSAGVVIIAASAGDDLTVDEIPNRTFFQRDGTSFNVSREGTYTGTVPDTVEEQLYAEDGVTVLQAWIAWTDLSATGGNLTGVLPAPQGGMYRSRVRTKAGGVVLSTQETVSANIWAVGGVFAEVGSSSAVGVYAGAGLSTNANTGRHAVGAWTTPSTGAISIFLNAWADANGIPCAILSYGVSGATLAGTWLGNTTEWNNFAAAVASVGKLEGVFISVGSNDAANNSIVSRSAHLTNLQALATRIRNLTGQPSLEIFQTGSNRRLSLAQTQADYLHLAENDFGDGENCFHIQTIDLEVGADNIHLVPGPTGYQGSCARRAYQVINKTRRGPKIASVASLGDVLTATLTHRGATDFTPTSGITGFTVSDASGTPAILSVVRTNAVTINITCDRALVGPTTLKYLSGGWPDVSANVFDNGATALPMVMTSQTAPEGHLLVLETSNQSNVSSTDAVVQTHMLTAANGAQVNSSTPGVVTQTHNLVASNSSQVNTSTVGAVEITHTLVAAESTQANLSPSVAIGATSNLGAANSLQINSSSNVTITQTHNLVVGTSQQVNSCISVAVVVDNGEAPVAASELCVYAPGAYSQIYTAPAVSNIGST